MSELDERVRQAVAAGYRRLGVPADYRLPIRGLYRVAFILHLLHGNLLDCTSFSEQLISSICQRPFANEDPVAAAISSLIVDYQLPHEEATFPGEFPNRKLFLRQQNIALIEAVVQQTASIGDLSWIFW
jgi:hypothetical protein